MKINKNFFVVGTILLIVFAMSVGASYWLLKFTAAKNISLNELIATVKDKSFYQSLPSKIPKAYVVQSGSMEPAIATGSIVISVPTESYWIGDVVTFSQKPGSGKMVTHRIMNRSFPEGLDKSPVYQTSGDANEDFDPGKVEHSQVVGKVSLIIPYLGYAADFAKKPYGFILLVIVPATIIVYEELKKIFIEIGNFIKAIFEKFKKKEEEVLDVQGRSLHSGNGGGVGGEEREGFLKGASVLVPVLGAFLVVTGVAASYFSDMEKVVGNVFSASSDFSANVSVSPTPTQTPQATNHIVISEVQITGGPGDGGHDFIELYNPTGMLYDLNGHTLVQRTGNAPNDIVVKTWNTQTIIPAYGFYLWASSADGDSPFIQVADTTSSNTLGAQTSIGLRNGPENTGVLIDSVSWNEGSTFGEGTVFSPNPAAGESIERKANGASTAATMAGGVDTLKGNGFDSDNNSFDFVLRAVSEPQNSASPIEIP